MKFSTEQDSSLSYDVPGFGLIQGPKILAQDALFLVVWDRYPVSPGHCLIIPKRGTVLFGELNGEEKTRLIYCIYWCLGHLAKTLRLSRPGLTWD